jgi:uncharacterized protein
MKQNFLIKTESIPEDGLQIKANWDAQIVDEIVQHEDEEFRVCSPLSLTISISLLGKKVILVGKLQLMIDITCVCCLSDFKHYLEVEFRYVLWPHTDTQQESGEKEFSDQDIEIGYYNGDIIDLKPIVREQVYLALPQNPHCREACKGLCPACGANLNEIRCNCSVTNTNVESPFEVLKKLKKS